MVDSAPLSTSEALAIARRRLAQPLPHRPSTAGALGASALAALGGLSAAWIVVLGPSLTDSASAEPVRTVIATPAGRSGLRAP